MVLPVVRVRAAMAFSFAPNGNEALARRVRLDPEAVKRKLQLSATTCRSESEWRILALL
jgi:hypothetical protein